MTIIIRVLDVVWGILYGGLEWTLLFIQADCKK
jgi:hypothetical protein